MTANTVNGSGNGARSGAQTLVLLATPLNVQILRELCDGAEQQSDLRRRVGMPAQTTLRAQLKRLAEIAAIEKRRRNRFPGVIEYELTASGRELLFVVDVLERWLEQAPGGALPLGDNSAKAAIKALAEAWSAAILRVLAVRPFSLTELGRVIRDLSYPSLERRLMVMRLTGQLEARPSNGHGTPYAVTDWLRRGAAPIVAAIRWERRHAPQMTAPLSGVDAETAFMLAMPLLRLPPELAGSCRMAAELPTDKERRLTGVVAEAKGGAVVACATDLNGDPDAWALGSPAAWLSAIVEHEVSRLELGGNCRLARAFVDGLHEALFELPVPAHLDAGVSIRDAGLK